MNQIETRFGRFIRGQQISTINTSADQFKVDAGTLAAVSAGCRRLRSRLY